MTINKVNTRVTVIKPGNIKFVRPKIIQRAVYTVSHNIFDPKSVLVIGKNSRVHFIVCMFNSLKKGGACETSYKYKNINQKIVFDEFIYKTFLMKGKSNFFGEDQWMFHEIEYNELVFVLGKIVINLHTKLEMYCKFYLFKYFHHHDNWIEGSCYVERKSVHLTYPSNPASSTWFIMHCMVKISMETWYRQSKVTTRHNRKNPSKLHCYDRLLLWLWHFTK